LEQKWRILRSDFLFLFGSIWALVGTPFVCIGLFLSLSRPKDGLIFVLLGALFGGVGWTLVIKAWRKASRVVELFANGLIVEGRVDQVVVDRSVQINQRHPSYLAFSFEGRDGLARYTAGLAVQGAG
jgi:hypothetical protein